MVFRTGKTMGICLCDTTGNDCEKRQLRDLHSLLSCLAMGTRPATNGHEDLVPKLQLWILHSILHCLANGTRHNDKKTLSKNGTCEVSTGFPTAKSINNWSRNCTVKSPRAS